MFKAQVVILAGGQGSRLRPYTVALPKPLLPVGDIPILEIIIRQLKHGGFKDIVIATGYLAELIEAYFGKGEKWGVNIRYVHEDKPLGTAGALKLIKQTTDHFLVLNGDLLTDMNYAAFLKWHIKRSDMASLVIKERRMKGDFGVIEVGKDHEMKAYHEKPEHTSFVSIGVNAFNKKVKTLIHPDESIGIPELMLRVQSKGQKVSCYEIKDFWLDLGRLGDFEGAQEIFAKNRKKFLLD